MNRWAIFALTVLAGGAAGCRSATAPGFSVAVAIATWPDSSLVGGASTFYFCADSLVLMPSDSTVSLTWRWTSAAPGDTTALAALSAPASSFGRAVSVGGAASIIGLVPLDSVLVRWQLKASGYARDTTVRLKCGASRTIQE